MSRTRERPRFVRVGGYECGVSMFVVDDGAKSGNPSRPGDAVLTRAWRWGLRWRRLALMIPQSNRSNNTNDLPCLFKIICQIPSSHAPPSNTAKHITLASLLRQLPTATYRTRPTAPPSSLGNIPNSDPNPNLLHLTPKPQALSPQPVLFALGLPIGL